MLPLSTSLFASDLQLRIFRNAFDWKTPASLAAVAFVAYQYDSRSGYFIIFFYLVAQFLLLFFRSKFIASVNMRFFSFIFMLLITIIIILNFEWAEFFAQTQFLDTFFLSSASRDSNRLTHYIAYFNYSLSYPLKSFLGSGIYSHKTILADFLTPSLLSQLDKSHYLPGMGLESVPTVVRTNFILAGLVDLGIFSFLTIFMSVASGLALIFGFKFNSNSIYLVFLLPSLIVISLSSNVSDALLAFLLLMLPFFGARNYLLPTVPSFSNKIR